jgi:hypothetical protein
LGRPEPCPTGPLLQTTGFGADKTKKYLHEVLVLSRVGDFHLNGLRRIALTVAVLAFLFSGFFWLGYWTGVGHTLVKQRVPMPATATDEPASAPVHQIEEGEEPMRL